MDPKSEGIKVFAEYLFNLRAVNLYVFVQSSNIGFGTPTVTVKSNDVQINVPDFGNFYVVLEEISLQDCSNIIPRKLEEGVYCFRLIVNPDVIFGSSSAEIVSSFERTVDQGAKNLVKNSINKIALREDTCYLIKCRFCSKFLSDEVKFAKIRPLPSTNWIENAHELWYCHPPHPSNNEGQSDVADRLQNINLSSTTNSATLGHSRSVVDLISRPEKNHLFYGPCNWALDKTLVQGVTNSISTTDRDLWRTAVCSFCGNELGSFTSEHCVKLWDFGIVWVDQSEESEEDVDVSGAYERALLNFKSIVFATIYELSDHPTFRFTVRSSQGDNSSFLWNIDRNLCVYEQSCVSISGGSDDTIEKTRLRVCTVAKFFFGVKENGVLPIQDPRELTIITETEENEQNFLTIPHYVYNAGIEGLRRTSVLYSRDKRALQCGYLKYDA